MDIVPEDVSRALAAEIKERREHMQSTVHPDKYASQAEMARLAGFRWTTSYQRLEYHDRIIDVLQLVAIANVLGTTADELLRVAQIRAAAGDFPTPPNPP